MISQIESTECPLCNSKNECKANKIENCWCMKTEIPKEILELVPEGKKNKACICQKCIQKFKDDPVEFKKNIIHQ